MKKVLSLVLAFMMVLAMAVPALASNECYLEMTEKSVKKLGEEGQMLPGYIYYFDLYIDDIEVEKSDFTIKIELDKGSDKFVESYGIEDDQLYIKVANDRSMNVEEDYIGFEVTLKARNNYYEDDYGIEKGDEFYCGDGYDVGNDLYYVDVAADKEDAEIYDGTNDDTSYRRPWLCHF